MTAAAAAGASGSNIRRCALHDHDWMRETAAEVYRPFGEYRDLATTWLQHPHVLTYVEESREPAPALRGFIVLAFSDEEVVRAGSCFADLLAIAVAPRYRLLGIGRALLGYAIHVARLAAAYGDVPELRLTVADSNAAARRMFMTAGFREVDPERGRYAGDQRAIRMALSL